MTATLHSQQWRKLTESVSALAALPASGDVLLELLRLVERVIPCSLARFSAIDPVTFETIGVNTHVISCGGDDLDLLAPAVLASCPFTRATLNPDAPGVMRLTDCVSAPAFWVTESWQTFYRPANSRYTMSARLSPAGSRPILAIDLDRDLIDFTPEEALMFDLLRPHLRDAYEKVCAIERRRRMTANLDGLTERLALDAAWLPLGTAHEPALRTPPRVPPIAPHLPRTMAEAVWLHYGSFAREDLGAANWNLRRTVQGAEGPELFLMNWDASNGHTVVERRGRDAGPIGRPQAWRPLRSLGLTDREAEVLYWVSEGKSNDVIGQILGLSGRTVQKHVENTHRKLGVEGRTAAAATALRHLLG